MKQFRFCRASQCGPVRVGVGRKISEARRFRAIAEVKSEELCLSKQVFFFIHIDVPLWILQLCKRHCNNIGFGSYPCHGRDLVAPFWPGAHFSLAFNRFSFINRANANFMQRGLSTRVFFAQASFLN